MFKIPSIANILIFLDVLFFTGLGSASLFTSPVILGLSQELKFAIGVFALINLVFLWIWITIKCLIENKEW